MLLLIFILAFICSACVSPESSADDAKLPEDPSQNVSAETPELIADPEKNQSPSGSEAVEEPSQDAAEQWVAQGTLYITPVGGIRSLVFFKRPTESIRAANLQYALVSFSKSKRFP